MKELEIKMLIERLQKKKKNNTLRRNIVNGIQKCNKPKK